MHYDGTVYRPPFEANSFILQVTSGCSHNSCTFCTMYKDVPFRVSPESEIDADIAEAVAKRPHTRRVFLVGGDAFALSGEKLACIAEKLHTAFPMLETISMYASIKNIRTKSDEELRQLAELGIDDLNVGVESGDEETLLQMNKGFTAEEAERELLRLKKAGIHCAINIILGGAGATRSHEHALASAKLMNAVQPKLIFVGTMHPDEDSAIQTQIRTGVFKECNIGNFLEEERLFIEHLALENCELFGLHPSNVILLRGYLPEDQEAMLEEIDYTIDRLSDQTLASQPHRGAEGGIIGLR